MKHPLDWASRLLALGLTVIPSLPAHPIVASYERFHSTASESAGIEGGVLLLNELNCVACHAPPDAWRERLPGRGRIALNDVGSKLPEERMAEFIAAPAILKPGTTMPSVAKPPADARSIAAYLAEFKMPLVPPALPMGDATRGQQLFETIGCAACHAPPKTATSYPSVPIALASHYERNALIAFLKNPLHTRPGGRMPATEMTEAEACDVAAYLKPGDVARAARAVGSEGDAQAGRARFVTLSCAACHDIGEPAPASVATPLDRVRVGQGCLASEPGATAADFSLNQSQRRALAAALGAIQSTPSPAKMTVEQRVTAKFEQLNCYACHEWRGRGGAEPARARFFTATDSAVESLGEIGHLPPKLDAAGRKLTPAWLQKLLWGGSGGVRPYMTARMPRYGEMAAGELVSLLGEACRPAQPQTIDTSGGQGHQRFATGRTLLGSGTGGIGCVACHGLKNREPSGVRTINLTHTAQRLQPEYFKALLLDPQGVQPGTIMPPLFAGRKAADKEIESIWTYFKELDQSDLLPDGLAVAGSFELKPQEDGRPIVFRTFLDGAGTQAIAVGFPAGAHAAFDAFEVRWALAWRGRFLDAQTNWEERPMKPIKPLGDMKRALPTHMPFARLREPTEPWPSKFGSYAGYVFKGYRLAPDGTPTFRYAIDELEIEDTLRPTADGAALLRRVVVRGNGRHGSWYFRGSSGGISPQVLVWRDGVAVIEETIVIHESPSK
jgi:cytochrome c2